MANNNMIRNRMLMQQGLQNLAQQQMFNNMNNYNMDSSIGDILATALQKKNDGWHGDSLVLGTGGSDKANYDNFNSMLQEMNGNGISIDPNQTSVFGSMLNQGANAVNGLGVGLTDEELKKILAGGVSNGR